MIGANVRVPEITRKSTNNTALAQAIPLVASAIVTAVIVGSVLKYSRYGIDIKDESHYLIWMTNPFDYPVSLSQFGFIYHPLFELLGGRIAGVRQANILITWSLAWVLSNVFLVSIYGRQAVTATRRLVISGGIATASLAFLATLPPTPSYNSLAMQALLVATIGWLLADKKVSLASISGWVMIGIGGWLAFMAKPSTAAALAVCSAVYLIVSGKLSYRLLLIALVLVTVLLLCSALFIDGSITAFVARLRVGLQFAELLEGPNSLTARVTQVDYRIGLRASSKVILIVTTALICIHAFLSLSRVKIMALIGVGLAILLAIASVAIASGYDPGIAGVSRFAGLLVPVPIATILVGFVLFRVKGFLQLTRPQWACALSFLVLPNVYTLGTGNRFWMVAPNAALFWILSALGLISPATRNSALASLLLSLALAVQLLTIIRIQSPIEAPYSQPQPLRTNDYVMDIGRPGSKLILSRSFGLYFAEAIELTKRGGFRSGSPMIDLTGQSPGILYAVGAKSTGLPWIIGGYTGSDNVAVKSLKTVPCAELGAAWLLTEPGGPQEISPTIVASFGANATTDFEIVGTIRTPEGAGGYKIGRLQQFLKPIRPAEAAIAACVAERASAN